MGLFGGSSSDDKNPKATSSDPWENLDPSLREFLEKESPVKYDTSNPPAPAKPRPEPPKGKDPAPLTTTEESEAPKIPPPSLFPDGRYAHLWKTYESPAAAAEVAKSDQEKLDDIVQGYKHRKSEIGRAALENCVLEQFAISECFSNGALAKYTMCQNETKKLNRCYTMQSKILTALGYLSHFDNQENDEKIQMHADTLYQRMLSQEAAISAAKEAGEPIPTFPPIMTSKTTADLTPVRTKPEDLQPHVQEQLKARLKGKTDAERQVEEMAIMDEMRAGEKIAKGLNVIHTRWDKEKEERLEKGKETLMDRISTLINGIGTTPKPPPPTQQPPAQSESK